MIIDKNQQLVVTTIGTDRPGIVSQLAKIVNDNNCSIIDSKMAVFGDEFTSIMLLVGELSAINIIEHTLPQLARELGLLTMTKRTKRHSTTEYSAHFDISLVGEDHPGMLCKVTSFLAEKNIDISSLKLTTQENDHTQNSELNSDFTLHLPTYIEPEKFREEFINHCNHLNIACQITTLQG